MKNIIPYIDSIKLYRCAEGFWYAEVVALDGEPASYWWPTYEGLVGILREAYERE